MDDDQERLIFPETTLLESTVIEKWFKIGSDGCEFHGYAAGEVIQILAQMGQGGDAVRYSPHGG